MQHFISRFSVSIVSALYFLFVELPLLNREIGVSVSPADAGNGVVAFIALMRLLNL